MLTFKDRYLKYKNKYYQLKNNILSGGMEGTQEKAAQELTPVTVGNPAGTQGDVSSSVVRSRPRSASIDYHSLRNRDFENKENNEEDDDVVIRLRRGVETTESEFSTLKTEMDHVLSEAEALETANKSREQEIINLQEQIRAAQLDKDEAIRQKEVEINNLQEQLRHAQQEASTDSTIIVENSDQIIALRQQLAEANTALIAAQIRTATSRERV